MNEVEQFAGAIRTAFGQAPRLEEVVPGKLVRFATSNKKGDEAGWCKLFDDGEGGVFGCWRSGVSETWQARIPRTAEGQAAFLVRVKQAKEEAAISEEENRRECREQSAYLWEKGRYVNAKHPYLVAKSVKPHGIKQLRDSLLVPVRDTAETLHGLQFIMSDGSKRFKTGSTLTGCYHAIGKPNGTILVAEGYATGATLHEATGHAVACAFTAGNLKPVAEALKLKYPDIVIVLCADDDHATEGNPGLTKATEAARAVGGLMAVPCFPPTRGEGDTDFNDLCRLAGAEAVRRQVELAKAPRLNSATIEAATPERPVPFSFRRLSDIQAKPIRWLWPGRIARGKVSMLAGHPGLGKSQLTASMAAIVTTGGYWPVDKTRCERGNVVFISAEDDVADTIRPRLEAAGADLDRVVILDAVLEDGGTRQRAFNLKADLSRLGQMLEYIGDVALVVIDPITAYLGNTDSHKNADMRALLSPLGELAGRHGAAVVCVSHLNKGGGGEALMRVTGSLAFVAAARAAFLIARDQGDKHRRLFLPIKNNIGNDESGLAFTIESATLSGGIETSLVSWENEAVTITADEAMAPEGDPEERSVLDDAKVFLTNLLADGPVSSRQIRADAEGAGFAWRTIQRAQKALDIDAYKGGMKEGWLWMLPPKDANKAEERQEKTVAHFDDFGALRQDEQEKNPR
jgi:putative DNA primase/helicase